MEDAFSDEPVSDRTDRRERLPELTGDFARANTLNGAGEVL
jgi:hypothetical protein